MTIKIGIPPVEATPAQKDQIRTDLDLRTSSQITAEITAAVSTLASVAYVDNAISEPGCTQ